mgnify:CR=1 FL=1
MERKKITFDSFIRGSIGCALVSLPPVHIRWNHVDNIRQFYTWFHRMCTGGRDTNACGTAQRSVITFLYSLADRLHGLSVSQVFPV